MFERAKEMAERLTRRDGARRRAHELYVAIAEAARRPVFYTELEVPDTVEGRYEMLSLHMVLVLRRLKDDPAETEIFSQLLFDVMFRDVDDTLREMGVGDLRVGKKVRSYAEAFFGRVLAYEKAFAGEESLEAALSRNVYETRDHPRAADLARYVEAADRSLRAVDVNTMLSGEVRFPEPRPAVAE
ncbi:MAG: ubiquinol-cytochrome C chaperone family protein [Parvularcula sp.]|nr:ubiquinol-cytochrome C chaperone family protein [Parvularcula sp.]